MAYSAILSISLFLLIVFGVERICRAKGIPSVLVLVVGGLIARPVLDGLGIQLAWTGKLVPVIGTIGLVLIVLEGALDIELRRERVHLVTSTFLLASAGFTVAVFVFAIALRWLLDCSVVEAVLVATPFAVISSAVAIPSSNFLPSAGRDFVVYESSMSDIIGVLVFFSLIGSDGTVSGALMSLLGGGFFSLLLSMLCAIVLMFILLRIDGYIRFVPLLAGLFALYAIGKLLHLSPLIMVLFLGLLLNKPELVTNFAPLRNWVSDEYPATLSEFKTLVVELTFVVRGFFFVLLGYWADMSDLISPWAWLAAIVVMAVIYGSRFVMLRLMSTPVDFRLLLWIAPRGLITVLLFLEARDAFELPGYLNGAVMLVVLGSSAMILATRKVQGKQASSDAQ